MGKLDFGEKRVSAAQGFSKSIQPQSDVDALWAVIKRLDPLFGEELPPNDKALGFYSNNLTSCLKRMGGTDEYAAAKPVGKPGETPTGIVFEIKKCRGKVLASH